MNETSQAPGSAPLNGWKDIAAYLGRSVRAVQRWEHELGLPVHRIRTPDGQTVYAFRHEIDAWREKLDGQRLVLDEVAVSAQATAQVAESADRKDAEPRPEQRDASVPLAGVSRRVRPALWLTLAVAVVVTLALVVWAAFPGSHANAMPTDFTMVGRLLEARDHRQRLLWSHDFGVDVTPALGGAHWRVADLDDDGIQEAVVAVRFSLPGQPASRSDALYGFSLGGRLLWSVTAPDTLTCGAETFSNPWRIHAIAVSNGPGPRTTWVAFNHNTWWPAIVLEIGPDGAHRIRYAQTGWIHALASWTTPSGSYLAVGGVTNDLNRPILALLDLSKAPAMTPAVAARFSCAGLPSGAPSALFLLPNPEIVAAVRPYTFVKQTDVMGAVLKAAIDAQGGTEIVHVSPDFTVADVSFSDQFWFAHQQFEREGKIRHSAEKCPERVQQIIRRWMPTTGWQDFKIVPTVRTTLNGAGR